MTRIYLSAPHMSGDERRLVGEVFDSNWLSSVGPALDRFESDFSKRVGRPAVALASGTAAMHLGLRLLGVGRGDDVICPTFTFVASANPIVYLGARPVFVDCERQSWNIDPNRVEDLLKSRSKRPKAMVVVHLYGQTADMDALLELSQRFSVPLFEDAAEAAGALHRGRPAGSLGEAAAFSFNGNKIITTTGGGMLVTKDTEAAAKARFWSQQARDPGVAYTHSELGYNYRMSNLLAAVGVGQLAVLDERVRQRRAIAARYADAFADLEGMSLMPQANWGLHTNWLSCFLVDEQRLGCSREAIIDTLAARDIEARPVWKPMHLQALFAGAEVHGGEVAEELFRAGLCLPSSSSMSPDDQARVIAAVRDAVHHARAQHLTSRAS